MSACEEIRLCSRDWLPSSQLADPLALFSSHLRPMRGAQTSADTDTGQASQQTAPLEVGIIIIILSVELRLWLFTSSLFLATLYFYLFFQSLSSPARASGQRRHERQQK